jgi:hypothetical protein
MLNLLPDGLLRRYAVCAHSCLPHTREKGSRPAAASGTARTEDLCGRGGGRGRKTPTIQEHCHGGGRTVPRHWHDTGERRSGATRTSSEAVDTLVRLESNPRTAISRTPRRSHPGMGRATGGGAKTEADYDQTQHFPWRVGSTPVSVARREPRHHLTRHR